MNTALTVGLLRRARCQVLSLFAFETMLWHICISFLVLCLNVGGQSMVVNKPYAVSSTTRLDRVLKTLFSRIGATNCTENFISWSGGVPPYNVSIYSSMSITSLCPPMPNNPSALSAYRNACLSFPYTNNTSLTFNVIYICTGASLI